MAGIKLVTGALPKSRAGRKAEPLNEELITALVSHLSENPFTKDENGTDRPNFAGDGTEYPTQGKAASAGRKYAQAVAKEMDRTVRVHVGSNGKNKDAERFSWVIYLPVSEMPSENGSEDES